jgi:hypothetical protein
LREQPEPARRYHELRAPDLADEIRTVSARSAAVVE